MIYMQERDDSHHRISLALALTASVLRTLRLEQGHVCRASTKYLGLEWNIVILLKTVVGHTTIPV